MPTNPCGCASAAAGFRPPNSTGYPLLHFVNEDINLAHLAQDIGYPDSTHFSHSIRRFYGLQPRAIFSGSRDLAIYRSDPHLRDSAGFRQGRP
jgi:AraC-like DNA-binding protein